MPRFIVKLATPAGDRYFEWSTIVDAPVTYGMPLDEFTAFYRHQYGAASDDEFAERMARVEATGTSARGDTVKDLISGNRAGPGESTMTMKQLIAWAGMSGDERIAHDAAERATARRA